MQLDREQKKLLNDVLERYSRDYRYEFQQLLSHVTDNENAFAPRLHLSEPRALREYSQRLGEAMQAIAALPEEGGELADVHAPFLREAIVAERLKVAGRVEAHKARTHDPELTAQIMTQLAPYDAIVKEAWLRRALPIDVPHPRDYFPLYLVEQAAGQSEKMPARHLAEKFHILQAPFMFQLDLSSARRSSKLRDISCAVAYLDIDDFKKVNSEYGEPFVDLNVLPTVMHAIEAHAYQRGWAYRFGGDEYALLLHNTSVVETGRSLEQLRNTIQALQFRDTRDGFRITVSVGFIVVASNCHLTGSEVESIAALAKQHAKESGKNRIATFDGPWFEKATLLGQHGSE